MRASRSKPLEIFAALAYAATHPATLRAHLGQIYDGHASARGASRWWTRQTRSRVSD
jgi:hypothetical protein